MCQACDASNGYFKSFHDECKQCGSGFGLNLFFFIFEFLIFLLLEIYVVYSDYKCLSNHNINDFEGIDICEDIDDLEKLFNVGIKIYDLTVSGDDIEASRCRFSKREI